MREVSFHCYVRGTGDRWEAICIDLDLVVNGRTQQEAIDLMFEAIHTYVEDAHAEAPEQRDRLLARRAPLSVRLQHALGHSFFRVRSTLRRVLPARIGPTLPYAGDLTVPCHV